MKYLGHPLRHSSQEAKTNKDKISEIVACGFDPSWNRYKREKEKSLRIKKWKKSDKPIPLK